MGIFESVILPYTLGIFTNKSSEKLNSIFKDNEKLLKKLFVESFIQTIKSSNVGYFSINSIYDSLIKKIEENDEKLFILIESESSNKNENFLNLIKDSDFSFNFVKKLFKEYSLEIKNINSDSLLGNSLKNLLNNYEIMFFRNLSTDTSLSLIFKETLKIDNLAQTLNSIAEKITEFDEVRKILTKDYLINNVDYSKSRDQYDAYLQRKYEFLELAGFSPKISGKDIFMKLTDVFIPLMIDGNDSSEKKLTPKEAIENILDSKHKSLVILGDPGSGKSTLLKYIASFISSNRRVDWLYQDTMPLLIKVSEYAEWYKTNNKNLFEYIKDLDSQHKNIFIENLECSNLLILLDGLDEVTDSSIRNKIVSNIIDLKARYPFNRYIVTSRIIGYRESSLSGHFQESRLQDFSEDDVKQFSNQWYKSIAQNEISSKVDIPELEINEINTKYDNLAKELFLSISRNSSVIKFAKNPLLMTIIVMIFFQSKKLPNKRVELYEIATETFLDNWVRVRFEENSKFKDKGIMLEILPHIAFEIHSGNDKGLIDEELFKKEFIELYQEINGVDLILAKKEFIEFKEFLEKYTGFFYRKDLEGNLYGFVHLTFEEYLAALELKSKWDLKNLKLENYVFDSRWSEVLRLAIANLKISNRGISGRVKATQFINDILKVDDEYPELFRLFQLVLLIFIDDVEINNELKEEMIIKFFFILEEHTESSLLKALSNIFGEINYSIYRNDFFGKVERILESRTNERLLINIFYILINNSEKKEIEKFIYEILNKYGNQEYFFKALNNIPYEVLKKIKFEKSFLIENWIKVINEKELIEDAIENISHKVSKILENKKSDNIIDLYIELYNLVQNVNFTNIFFRLIIREFYSFGRNDKKIANLNKINNVYIKKKLKKTINFINEYNKEENYSFKMTSYAKEYIIIKTDNKSTIKDLKNLKEINIDKNLLTNIENGRTNYSDEFIELVYYVFGQKQENNIDIFFKYAEKGEIFSFFNWEYFALRNLRKDSKRLSKYVLLQFRDGERGLFKDEDNLNKVLITYYENKDFFNDLDAPVQFIILKLLNIQIDKDIVDKCFELMKTMNEKEKEIMYNLLFEHLNPYYL